MKSCLSDLRKGQSEAEIASVDLLSSPLLMIPQVPGIDDDSLPSGPGSAHLTISPAPPHRTRPMMGRMIRSAGPDPLTTKNDNASRAYFFEKICSVEILFCKTMPPLLRHQSPGGGWGAISDDPSQMVIPRHRNWGCHSGGAKPRGASVIMRFSTEQKNLFLYYPVIS